MLVEIEPRVVARVRQLIDQVGEAEFRRGVAQMTRWDTEIRSLDAVIELYVMAKRGRVAPPSGVTEPSRCTQPFLIAPMMTAASATGTAAR
jgi:hypothetical protein